MCVMQKGEPSHSFFFFLHLHIRTTTGAHTSPSACMGFSVFFVRHVSTRDVLVGWLYMYSCFHTCILFYFFPRSCGFLHMYTCFHIYVFDFPPSAWIYPALPPTSAPKKGVRWMPMWHIDV
eukprot:GEMP01117610.1.p1 GENE.GEMP01117610.1~~GEMP01117610.1.p1  ORF type:complete len:121 (+),score=5.23 GEMP01117610.1:203-565(+)